MSEFNRENVYSASDGFQRYMTKVFSTMGIGLAITALIAYAGYVNLMNGGFMMKFALSGFSNIIMLFVQLGICIALGRGLQTMDPAQSKILFFVYSAVTGLTFSVLPLAFGVATVFTAFAFAAVMFFSTAIIGHFTNVDLTKFSGILMGGLLSLVLVSILGMFIPSIGNSLFISYAGIVIFMGLTAWDTQKLKAYYYQAQGSDILTANLAVYGAFQLYLDFINIFLYVLRIVGSRSSRD